LEYTFKCCKAGNQKVTAMGASKQIKMRRKVNSKPEILHETKKGAEKVSKAKMRRSRHFNIEEYCCS